MRLTMGELYIDRDKVLHVATGEMDLPPGARRPEVREAAHIDYAAFREARRLDRLHQLSAEMQAAAHRGESMPYPETPAWVHVVTLGAAAVAGALAMLAILILTGRF